MGAGGPTAACDGIPGWPLTAQTTGAGATRDLAGAVATLCRPGDVVLLAGGLGAGKTTFAQGFARGLGVTGPVTSPTFTLVRQYRYGPEQAGLLLHADVYRLETLAEVLDLGLVELVEDGALALVEWGDVVEGLFGAHALTVSLVVGSGPGTGTEPGEPTSTEPGEPTSTEPGEPTSTEPGDETRLVVVEGGGDAWTDRRARLAEVLAPFAPGATRAGGAAGAGEAS